MATLFRRSLSFYRDNLFPPLFLPVPAQHEDRTATKLCRIITTENGPGSRQARRGASGRIRRVPCTADPARATSGASSLRPSTGPHPLSPIASEPTLTGPRHYRTRSTQPCNERQRDRKGVERGRRGAG